MLKSYFIMFHIKMLFYIEIETKLKWELIKLKSFFHRKGNYKLYEKTTLRMGKKELHMKQLTKDLSPKYTNNSYSSIQEKQQPNQTIGRRPKQTFLQRCYYCSVTKPCSGFPVLYYLPEFAEFHVHWVSDAII